MLWDVFIAALSCGERTALQKALDAVKNEENLNSEELAFIARGNRVDAIRSVRNRLGIPVKDARDLVMRVTR